MKAREILKENIWKLELKQGKMDIFDKNPKLLEEKDHQK